ERLGQPAVSLDDIRRFRQLDSKAPGHPEYHWVSGVEATTGPLGQGIAMSVGMAIAEKWLANRYNRPSFEIFDYNIYAVCGDGCMMEGVGSEAASLAGHLALDNLCWIYDNNHITIEGSTRITFTEDIAARFLGYGWNVLRVGDANDIDLIEHALDVFRKTKGRPTFIILDSHIGYGSPPPQEYPPGSWRTAGRRGSPPHQARLRMAAEPKVSGSRCRSRALRGRRWNTRSRGSRPLDRTVHRIPVGASKARNRDRTDSAPGAACRMGRGASDLSRRFERHRGARCIRESTERTRPKHPLAVGRIGRSRPVQQTRSDV